MGDKRGTLSKEKWYKSGLAFECRQCGRCCSGPGEGYIWVSSDEIDAISNFLQIKAAEFKDRYCYRVGRRYSLNEQQPSKDCIFLSVSSNGSSDSDNNSSGKGCRIYQVRPLQCRTWPFWKENLRSKNTWEHAAKHCPGIDSGLWHSPERIEAIRQGHLSQCGQAIPVWDAAIASLVANVDNRECLAALDNLYTMIDQHINAANPSCDNCGTCCDFDRFDHRLYVTTLEMLYFLANGPWSGPNGYKAPIAVSQNGKCPYQDKSKGCTVRAGRPAGCRIFYCRDLPSDFQSELTENVLKQLRDMHREFGLPYCYGDLRDWLTRLSHKNQPTG